MPGTIDNPVRFANPFRRIVEVSWRTDRYIALHWTPITRTDWVADAAFCTPATIMLPAPGWESQYVSKLTFHFDEAYPDGIDSQYVLKGDQWIDPGREQFEFSGLPGEQEFLYSAWAYLFFQVSGSTVVGSVAEHDNAAGFEAQTGSNMSVNVPSGPPFQSGLTPNWRYHAQPYTSSSPSCGSNGFVNGEVRPVSLTADDVSLVPLSIAGVGGTYRGKSYSGVGGFMQPVEKLGYLDVPFQRCPSIWILLERDDA